MAFVETANLKTKDKKGSFLGDVLATVGPMALGALGSIASGGMSQIGGGLVSSILGGGNESVHAMGGNIPQITKYASGGSHEQNSLGGIPVDSLGNPSGNPSALVEQGEVGYKLPNDQTGYVFSNRIKVPGKKHTFADEAKKVASRYKNRLGENLDKPDSLAKRALDMAMETLKNQQESIKQQEQALGFVQALGGYINAMGGQLNSYPEGGGLGTNPEQNFVPQTPQQDYVSKLAYHPENKAAARRARYNPPTDELNRGNIGGKSPVYTANYGETLPQTKKTYNKVPVQAGGYSSMDAAITSTLNNKGMRDIAVDNAFGDSLNTFLDPRLFQAIDSLNNANFAAGDTAGRHAAVEGFAKRFPKTVDPKKIFKQEDLQKWQESLGGSKLGFNNPLPYSGKTNSDFITGNTQTKGTIETEENRGNNLWGARNAAATHFNAFVRQVDTNPVSNTGRQLEGQATFTTPMNFDIKKNQFSSRATNVSGQDPDALLQRTSLNYSPDQYFRKYGVESPYLQKAYGGGLPKYDDGSNLPNQDRENYLKYHSGLPEAYVGYGLQAATRIPQLFTKPESIHYDRVTPETINLAQERGSMETSRNNQLGFLKRQAGMAGSAGQALNYLSSVVPQAYNQYDQQYAQSIEREQNANAQIMNQANAQNAQIQMREAEANAMERDAARSVRDQALADIGKTGLGALTAKKSALEQYNALKMQGMINDFDFAFDQNGVRIIRDGRKENTAPATNPTVTASTNNPITNSIGYNPYKATVNLPELGNTLQNNSPYFHSLSVPKLNTGNINYSPVETDTLQQPASFYTPQEERDILKEEIPPEIYSRYYNPDGSPKTGVFSADGNLKKQRKGGYLKKKGKK